MKTSACNRYKWLAFVLALVILPTIAQAQVRVLVSTTAGQYRMFFRSGSGHLRQACFHSYRASLWVGTKYAGTALFAIPDGIEIPVSPSGFQEDSIVWALRRFFESRGHYGYAIERVGGQWDQGLNTDSCIRAKLYPVTSLDEPVAGCMYYNNGRAGFGTCWFGRPPLIPLAMDYAPYS